MLACSLVPASIVISPTTEAHDTFKLEQTLATPEWMDLKIQNTTRYETIDHQFRAGYSGSDQILLTRTLLQFNLHHEPFDLVTEMIDTRQFLSDEGSRLTTSLIDSLDLIQAYLQYRPATGKWWIRAGRETVDLGSRRLMARSV